jgi:hypothetical protein
MRPQLTNEKACSENVVSSVALRVQPSLAKEPTPARACIDQFKDGGPHHRCPQRAPTKRREVTSRGMSPAHLTLHGHRCCRQINVYRDHGHMSADVTSPAAAP